MPHGVELFRRERGLVLAVMKSRGGWSAAIFRPSSGDPTKDIGYPLNLACGVFGTKEEAEAFIRDQFPKVAPPVPPADQEPDLEF